MFPAPHSGPRPKAPAYREGKRGPPAARGASGGGRTPPRKVVVSVRLAPQAAGGRRPALGSDPDSGPVYRRPARAEARAVSSTNPSPFPEEVREHRKRIGRRVDVNQLGVHLSQQGRDIGVDLSHAPPI